MVNEELWILYPQGDLDCMIQSITSLSSSVTVRKQTLNLLPEMIIPDQKSIYNISLFVLPEDRNTILTK
jgi:hypothetical protein